MARVGYFNIHRTWEDCLGMLLGILIVLTPALGGHGDNPAVLINTGLTGALVLALGALELVDLRRWEEGLELLLGLWLVASPFVLGYAASGLLMTSHLALGTLVAVVAVVELLQDWRLSDRDLAMHGR